MNHREIEALALLAVGLSDGQIAHTLGIPYTTVKNFVVAIKIKTRIKSRVLLAFYAYSKGYVSKEAIKAAMGAQREARGSVGGLGDSK